MTSSILTNSSKMCKWMSQVPLGVVPNRRSRGWIELNECLCYKRIKQYQGWSPLIDESEYESSDFTDPFTNKTTRYLIKGNILYRNGLEIGVIDINRSVLFALSHVACLVSNEHQTHIYDTNDTMCMYSFPLKNIVHVHFLYNINKHVLTSAQHSFVVIGPDEYNNKETIDDLILFSPSGPCVCFTETHEFAIYESNRCIVLAETLTPYRINPMTRIDESARRIMYNQNKKEIIVNNETILSMF